MTDPTSSANNPGTTSVGAPPDPELVKLVRLWDHLDEESGQPNSLGITLVIAGVTYSGLLVAGRVWARSMASLLHGASENTQVRVIGDFFDDIAAGFEKADGSRDARSYLHLVNVALGLPSSGTQSSLLLRIRLADVSAWTVGTMGPVPPFGGVTLGS